MATQTSNGTNTKILITGASGQYGRLAVEGLLARGIPPSSLLLLTRNPTKLSAYAQRGLCIRQGSFDDPVASLAAAFAGASTMLLISTSRAGARLPQHRTAIDAAAAAGVAHVVYTSIVSAERAAPTALVGREHRDTEAMLKEISASATAGAMKWTALRDAQYAEAMADVAAPAAVEAMADVAAPAAVEAGALRCNSGDGKVAFVARADCVAAAVAVLCDPAPHADRAYAITGPELLSWRDAARVMGEVAGRGSDGVVFESLTDEEMFATFDAVGIPREPVDDLVVGGYPWNSSDMVSFGKATRLGEMEVISGDVEMLTGRPPKSFREVLEESWARRKAASAAAAAAAAGQV
ncbi:putative ergot alkaloid biosynthetic protein a [Diplodia seriata]|uniref:Putative ergot alkaloid biosynthetic protein a n=1 Tax=Diplodia seriata TaxID=420778 RepID=A0A0G2ERB8_9PEZI|nr:putative ergot alkaloid biosynthetic protein a [Diplodia seriata]